MPNIRVYQPRNNELNPEEKGYGAFETAGRRTGPLYNQAAQDEKEIGRLQAQGFLNQRWPFDIFALHQFEEEGGSGGGRRGDSAGGGGGVKSDGGSKDPFGHDGFGSHGQASRGAGGLGQAANALARPGRYRSEDVDPETGRVSARGGGGGRQQRDPPPYSLQNGRFVRDDQNKFPLDGESRRLEKSYGEWYDKWVNPYGPQKTYDPKGTDEYGNPSDWARGLPSDPGYRAPSDPALEPGRIIGEGLVQGGMEIGRQISDTWNELSDQSQRVGESISNWIRGSNDDSGGSYGGGSNEE